MDPVTVVALIAAFSSLGAGLFKKRKDSELSKTEDKYKITVTDKAGHTVSAAEVSPRVADKATTELLERLKAVEAAESVAITNEP